MCSGLEDITASSHPSIETPPTMSALPRSIGSRLLPAAIRPSAPRGIAPKYRAFASTDASSEVAPKTSSKEAPNAPLTESAQGRQEGAAEAIRHKPDYNVAVDYRTSYVHVESLCYSTPNLPNRNFSPVPKRVMDGSEPGDVVAAAVLSGAPIDLQARTVRYAKPHTLKPSH